MADSVMASPTKKPIFIIELSGQNSNPILPDSFVSNHLNGNIQSTKLKLTSDASDRTWEVELDGQRFGRGWKHFSDHHCIRNNDVLSFRHDGDMVFHVTPFGRSFSKQNQYIFSTSEAENDRSDDDDEHNIFDDDVYDDDDEHADVGDDDDDDDELYPNKTSQKKRAITERESPSENTYLVAHVTPSNLRRNNMYLPKKFARSNGLNNRQCEIDLRNEHGESWTMDLTHNKTTCQTFVRNGWTSFCKSNKLKAESFCRFKLVQNGTKPVLQLCPNTEGDDEIEAKECLEPDPMNQNKTVALEFKPYMLTGRLRVPTSFGRANGITETGEITIVNKDGVEWKLHLGNMKGHEQYYIRGLKDFFIANGIKKVGDSFTLEAIRGGTNPILKICSKEASFDGYKTPPPRRIQASRAEEEKETRVQKKARVSAIGGLSQPTRASNRSSAGPANLQHKQPLQPCSISDQVAKVKQSVVDALTDVRKFRSELEIKERNLEAALLEIDVLGEKIMGISKFFNINQV